MSYSSSRYGAERRSSSSRRDYSPSRHRSRRSPSPGPSSVRPRDPSVLPESFGRMQDERAADDDLSVIQRMKSSYKNSPLDSLYNYIDKKVKVKVWTRNHKNVRGVLTGYIVSFDKHWNLIMKDCGDIFHKPKKSKTPFLRNISPNEKLPDMPVKVPKPKKEETAAEPEPPEDPESEKEVKKDGEPEKGGKRRKRRNKKPKKASVERGSMKKLFIRGDNVVMVTPDDGYIQIVENESQDE